MFIKNHCRNDSGDNPNCKYDTFPSVLRTFVQIHFKEFVTILKCEGLVCTGGSYRNCAKKNEHCNKNVELQMLPVVVFREGARYFRFSLILSPVAYNLPSFYPNAETSFWKFFGRMSRINDYHFF